MIRDSQDARDALRKRVELAKSVSSRHPGTPGGHLATALISTPVANSCRAHRGRQHDGEAVAASTARDPLGPRRGTKFGCGTRQASRHLHRNLHVRPGRMPSRAKSRSDFLTPAADAQLTCSMCRRSDTTAAVLHRVATTTLEEQSASLPRDQLPAPLIVVIMSVKVPVAQMTHFAHSSQFTPAAGSDREGGAAVRPQHATHAGREQCGDELVVPSIY